MARGRFLARPAAHGPPPTSSLTNMLSLDCHHQRWEHEFVRRTGSRWREHEGERAGHEAGRLEPDVCFHMIYPSLISHEFSPAKAGRPIVWPGELVDE